jgi:predicted MPP superfamily phosphohydrolase
VKIRGLPRALDGYVIGQVSDVHTGLYVGERDLDEGLSRLREVKADLIVVTGDIVDFDPFFAPLAARKLSEVTARDGVFAILGNHDHYTGGAVVSAALRAAGVRTLVNEGLVVRPGDGGGFALLGVDDLWSAVRGGAGPLLARAQAMVPDDRPSILLSHQPSTVDLWAGRVALQLSGHTHGGQVNPGFRPADFLLRYVAGRYDVRGTLLYVNRGFGTVGPPARVMAPPEVTRIILVAA